MLLHPSEILKKVLLHLLTLHNSLTTFLPKVPKFSVFFVPKTFVPLQSCNSILKTGSHRRNQITNQCKLVKENIQIETNYILILVFFHDTCDTAALRLPTTTAINQRHVVIRYFCINMYENKTRDNTHRRTVTALEILGLKLWPSLCSRFNHVACPSSLLFPWQEVRNPVMCCSTRAVTTLHHRVQKPPEWPREICVMV